MCTSLRNTPLTYHYTHKDLDTKRWNGQANITVDYFPPNVTHFNAYAIHNQQINGTDPIYKALYPSSGEEPDFHDLESFGEFSELPSLMNIADYSEIWKEALTITTTTTTATTTTKTATTPTSTAANIGMVNSFFYIVTIMPFILVR